jgi:hypothetical protein
MKKLLVAFLSLVNGFAFADVIPDNSHHVDKCIKIINASDFPEFFILAVTRYPGNDTATSSYIVLPDQCLEKGYKFNIFDLVAVRKKDASGKKIESYHWMLDKHTLKSDTDIDPEGYYTENSDPVSGIDEYYKIKGFTDTSMLLEKVKEVKRYIDGSPGSIRTAYGDCSGLPEAPGFKLSEFLRALLITVLSETLVLLILSFTWLRRSRTSVGRILIAGILPSALTLPFVWFVFPLFLKAALLYILFSESTVIVVEAFIMKGILKLDLKRALVVSFICNVISFLVGILVNWHR